jgi:type II secretory pathway component HofQ
MTGKAAACLVLAAALSGGAALAQALQTEIIPLRHRMAAEMIPLLQPLAGPGGAVTGMNSQLIVRASPEHLAGIQRVLAQMDAPPRRLMITVRQGRTGHASGLDAGAAASLGSDRLRVLAGGPVPNSGAGVQYRSGDRQVTGAIREYSTQGQDSSEQRVQAIEGQPAMIQVGQSMPVPQRQVVRGPGGVVQVIDGTQYRDATTGFQVLPRVNGQQVTLDINPQRNTPGAYPGSMQVQQLSTQVSGRLGEWIELGGVLDSASGGSSGQLYRQSGSGTEQRSVQVRVEELP